MKPSFTSIRKLWSIKGLSLVGIVLTVFIFQNCGPSFQENSLGEIQMSSFSGPVEYLKDPPSLNRTALPSGLNARPAPQTGTCTVGPNCMVGIYIKNSSN